MKLLSKITLSLFSLSLAASANAFNHVGDDITKKSAENSPHNVGLQIGGGGLEYKGNDTDGEGVAYSYLHYNYQFIPHYYVEVGLASAEDIDDWECDSAIDSAWQCYSDSDNKFELQADDFEYSGLVLALKTDMSLSEHNKLYAKAGVVFYDYEFGLNREKIVDEDGTGYMLEGGWEYVRDNGLGFSVSLTYQDLDDLEMTGLNFGLNYSF